MRETGFQFDLEADSLFDFDHLPYFDCPNDG